MLGARVIRNHPNYCIYDTGMVSRVDVPYSCLIPDISNGYPRVDLDGKKEYIARLVLEAFNPTDDETLKVFYIDGNPMNCRLDNLVWLSPSDIQRFSAYTVECRKQFFRGRS